MFQGQYKESYMTPFTRIAPYMHEFGINYTINSEVPPPSLPFCGRRAGFWRPCLGHHLR